MKNEHELFALRYACELLFPHNNQETSIRGKILLLVAEQGNCTADFLTEALDVNQSTISRETRSLCARTGRRERKNWRGIALLRAYRDTDNKKRYRYELTEAGQMLVHDACMNRPDFTGDL